VQADFGPWRTGERCVGGCDRWVTPRGSSRARSRKGGVVAPAHLRRMLGGGAESEAPPDHQGVEGWGECREGLGSPGPGRAGVREAKARMGKAGGEGQARSATTTRRGGGGGVDDSTHW